MRSTLRAIVAGGVMSAAAVLSLGAPAQAAPAAADAPAAVQGEAGTAAHWWVRGPFASRAACERTRDALAGLGYPTQACYYRQCGTAPGCQTGWIFRIFTNP
jgi:hypothetical protein